jgi:hypothetical protein
MRENLFTAKFLVPAGLVGRDIIVSEYANIQTKRAFGRGSVSKSGTGVPPV